MDKINLSRKAIEAQIQSMSLEFFSQKDERIEWKTKPPSFILSFYKFVYYKKRIPHQIEFWKYYSEENKNDFSENIKQYLPALKARCYRAYPSFVRDIHFYYLMVESNLFEQVLYHPEIDIKYGIDFVVRYKEKNFGINCYIDTPRSQQGREKKQFRHSKVKNLIHIDLPVHFKGCKKCGQFYLYSQRELSQLLKILNENNSLIV